MEAARMTMGAGAAQRPRRASVASAIGFHGRRWQQPQLQARDPGKGINAGLAFDADQLKRERVIQSPDDGIGSKTRTECSPPGQGGSRRRMRPFGNETGRAISQPSSGQQMEGFS